MPLETRISVPTRDLRRLESVLRNVGCVVLDAGERTTTEDGVGAEACVSVLFLEDADLAPLEAAGASR